MGAGDEAIEGIGEGAGMGAGAGAAGERENVRAGPGNGGRSEGEKEQDWEREQEREKEKTLSKIGVRAGAALQKERGAGLNGGPPGHAIEVLETVLERCGACVGMAGVLRHRYQ